MKTTYCQKLDFWMAMEPRTDLRVMKLDAERKMLTNPDETPAFLETIRVPVMHLLAVGPTEAVAEERGLRRARV